MLVNFYQTVNPYFPKQVTTNVGREARTGPLPGLFD